MPSFLVTGGCGYLGSQLIRDLAGAFPQSRIRVLDNLQRLTHQALMDLPSEGRYEFVEGDILDPATVRLALRGVDTVIHLAAVVRTPMSFDNPTWMQQVNHWGTSQLVEECLREKIERFTYASSSAVYGPGGPFDEESSRRPVGPYGTSKSQAEDVVLAAIGRGLRAVILRFGMLYGLAPATRFEGVVNHLAFRAGSGRSLTIHGDGSQRRPIVHVEDASNAVLMALREETSGTVFNVAAENPSVQELVSALVTISPATRVRYTSQDALTHLTFMMDNQRLRETSWTSTVDRDKALGAMVDRFSALQGGAELGS